jgi:ABC-type nitrate/sulfonate/bicarbonate transport system substrate-binding protein
MKHLLAGLAVLSLILAPVAAVAEDDVVRVGYLSQVHDGPVLALQDALGSQYKFEYVKFLRYADAEIALTKGDIDISSLGYVSAVTAANRGGDPAFQFFVGQSRGAINLVCKDGVKMAAWTDLSGHKVGVLTGGPAEIFFNDAVTSHGVKLDSIDRVTFPVPGPPLLQALQDGTIDCMAVYEPFAASAVADGYGVYAPLNLADNTFYGVNGGVAANTGFIAKHPEFLTAATKVLVETADSYPSNKAPWLASVVKVLGIPEKTAELSTDHVVLDWKLYRARIGVLAKAVAALGVIPAVPAPEAIDKLFTYQFLAAATGKSESELGLAD